MKRYLYHQAAYYLNSNEVDYTRAINLRMAYP